jgi:hypothetical protein
MCPFLFLQTAASSRHCSNLFWNSEKVGPSRPRQLGVERGWALDELTTGAFGP